MQLTAYLICKLTGVINTSSNGHNSMQLTAYLVFNLTDVINIQPYNILKKPA